jgi:hypothetical protein
VLVASFVLRRRGSDETAVFGAAVLASLLISPIVWSSYLLLLAVPLLVGGVAESGLIAFAVASWLLVTPHAASPTRVAVGAAMAVVVAVTAGPLYSHRQLFGRQFGISWAVGVTVCVVSVLLVGLSIALPYTARTPFVACVGSLAVGVTAFRSASRQPLASAGAGTDNV